MAYQSGKLYLVFRDESIFYCDMVFVSQNFLASVELCKGVANSFGNYCSGKIVVLDFFYHNNSFKGVFNQRLTAIDALAYKMPKVGNLPVMAQSYYAVEGFFKKYGNIDIMEEGIIIHNCKAMYNDNDAIYKWKKQSECTIDLRCDGRRCYTRDNRIVDFKCDNLGSGIYEFDLKGDVRCARDKAYANSDEVIKGVLYNYNFTISDLRNFLLTGNKPNIVPSFSILKSNLKGGARHVVCVDEIKPDEKDVDDEMFVEETEVVEIVIPLVPFSKEGPVKINMGNSYNTTEIVVRNSIITLPDAPVVESPIPLFSGNEVLLTNERMLKTNTHSVSITKLNEQIQLINNSLHSREVFSGNNAFLPDAIIKAGDVDHSTMINHIIRSSPAPLNFQVNRGVCKSDMQVDIPKRAISDKRKRGESGNNQFKEVNASINNPQLQFNTYVPTNIDPPVLKELLAQHVNDVYGLKSAGWDMFNAIPRDKRQITIVKTTTRKRKKGKIYDEKHVIAVNENAGVSVRTGVSNVVVYDTDGISKGDFQQRVLDIKCNKCGSDECKECDGKFVSGNKEKDVII
jgi:hypothetical protein